MRWQPSTSLVRALASLDAWNWSWHFICLSASERRFVPPATLSDICMEPHRWPEWEIFFFICLLCDTSTLFLFQALCFYVTHLYFDKGTIPQGYAGNDYEECYILFDVSSTLSVDRETSSIFQVEARRTWTGLVRNLKIFSVMLLIFVASCKYLSFQFAFTNNTEYYTHHIQYYSRSDGG